MEFLIYLCSFRYFLSLRSAIRGWNANVRSRWDAIEIKSIEAGNGLNATVEAGKEYEVTVVVDEKGLDDAIGIESVIIRREDGQDHIYEVIPLLPVSKNGNLYTFKATSGIFNAGSFKQAFRMYPKNALLPHRQIFLERFRIIISLLYVLLLLFIVF